MWAYRSTLPDPGRGEGGSTTVKSMSCRQEHEGKSGRGRGGAGMRGGRGAAVRETNSPLVKGGMYRAGRVALGLGREAGSVAVGGRGRLGADQRAQHARRQRHVEGVVEAGRAYVGLENASAGLWAPWTRCTTRRVPSRSSRRSMRRPFLPVMSVGSLKDVMGS